jgi:perosamine synthetase
MKDTLASIPVNAPLLDGHEREYLLQCLDTGWISSEGPFVQEFETRFAKKVGRRHGIAVANGSVALDLALAVLRLRPGDEVILPTFTIISCASAIVRAGATPVAVDCDSTWNVNVGKVERAITARTKAIMVVHLYGLPTDMDPLLEIADRYGLRIIEDAAEAHGLNYRGRPCGSFGVLSTFSFYPNKHVTTGEGGMIMTDDDELASRCRRGRNLCFQDNRRFVHEELGWNYRMTNLQAALGVAQLETLDEHIRRKREMGARYTTLLRDLPDLQLPFTSTPYADNSYWVFGLVLGDSYRIDAREAMQQLAACKIGTRPFFWPMHEQPVLRKMGFFANVSCPVAERIARRGFYLPSGLGLTADEIEKVAAQLRKVLLDARN